MPSFLKLCVVIRLEYRVKRSDVLAGLNLVPVEQASNHPPTLSQTDTTRSSSIVLFRRLSGEQQCPAGSRPSEWPWALRSSLLVPLCKLFSPRGTARSRSLSLLPSLPLSFPHAPSMHTPHDEFKAKGALDGIRSESKKLQAHGD